MSHLSNCHSFSTGSQRNPEATWKDNSAVLDRAPALASKNPVGLKVPHTEPGLEDHLELQCLQSSYFLQ